jgi:hypothetical protein
MQLKKFRGIAFSCALLLTALIPITINGHETDHARYTRVPSEIEIPFHVSYISEPERNVLSYPSRDFAGIEYAGRWLDIIYYDGSGFRRVYGYRWLWDLYIGSRNALRTQLPARNGEPGQRWNELFFFRDRPGRAFQR